MEHARFKAILDRQTRRLSGVMRSEPNVPHAAAMRLDDTDVIVLGYPFRDEEDRFRFRCIAIFVDEEMVGRLTDAPKEERWMGSWGKPISPEPTEAE
jgi:hypothetical protein